MSIITIENAFNNWESEIKPLVIEQYGEDDTIALSESWNDYTDSLCKDGQINESQYNYCPAYDESMPDCDATYLLESMGLSFAVMRIAERPDKLMSDMPTGSNHYRVLIKRGNKEMTVFYSMGPAHESEPDLNDVMYSLFSDTIEIENEYDFYEWCDNLGYDTDSRKAERIYKACQDHLLHLKTLFTNSEISDLREIFENY